MDASGDDWTLLGALDINDRGQIVGFGINPDGYQHGYLLTPDLSTDVDIDIKPGSDPNSINLGSNGVVPVAILTTDDFDATTVDAITVSLAGATTLQLGEKQAY